MEEADQIILSDLRSVGCQIPPEVTGCGSFNALVFVTCILKCLRLWERSREYLEKIPRSFAEGRAQRVNQANHIVKALKELGYNEDLSYHNLLYPNGLDTRRVLGWLLVQIPKENTVNDSSSALNQKIEDEIDFLTSNACIWTPEFCRSSQDRKQNFYKVFPLHTRYLYSPSTPVFYPGGRRITNEQKMYFSNYLPLFTTQVKSKVDVAASILEYNTRHFTEALERDNEWNSLGLASGLNPIEYAKQKQRRTLARMAEHVRAATNINKSEKNETMDDFLKGFGQSKVEDNRDGRATKFRKDEKEVVEQGETEEEINKRREKERDDIDKSLLEVEAKVLHTEQLIQVSTTEILQLTATLQKEADKTAELKKQFMDLKQTIELLSDAENNITNLRDFAVKSKEKLLDYAQKWEEVRVPLIEEYRVMKDSFSKREIEINKKLEEIKQIREEMKTLRAGVQRKDARYKQLLEILKGVPKENRATYTNKILVLVGGVKKQRIEISKILIDMRNVQKEINMISEKLNRTFAVVEEMIFQDAKKDPTGASSYKLTVQLNKVFTDLTDIISKTGQAANASLVLTDKIDKLQSRTTALNMQQIEEDLKQVRVENSKLVDRYKELTGKGKKDPEKKKDPERKKKKKKRTEDRKEGEKKLVVEDGEDKYYDDDE